MTTNPPEIPTTDAPLRVYLIRHGETEHNRARKIQGHTEVPLNDMGIAQAARLGERLAELPLDAIWASDLRRAAMTAAVIAARTGAPLAWDPLMRERHTGHLTDRSYDEALRFFTDPDYKPEGGEGAGEFDDRIERAFAELVEREAAARVPRRIAVVTHGMVCASFLKRHIQGSREMLDPVRWHNASLTICDWDGAWRLKLLSDVSHLDPSQLREAGSTKTGA